MKTYHNLINTGILLSGLMGLYGCSNSDKSSKKLTESKIEYFVDKKNIGDIKCRMNTAGVGMALADLDDDYDLDMITASPNAVQYFENTGSKNAPVYVYREMIGDITCRLNNAGISIALGDLDNDGDLDMITASPNAVQYFENTGSKTIHTFINKGSIGEPDCKLNTAGISVTLADLDGDNKLDIIVASPNAINYFRNNIIPKNK
jgi:hypothetical protein